jgi:hypothetical protein
VVIENLGNGAALVRIIDTRGKVVYTGAHISEAYIDLGTLAPGLYIVTVNRGRSQIVEKLIKY